MTLHSSSDAVLCFINTSNK